LFFSSTEHYLDSRILRSLDEGMFMASRYFATVLLATDIPSSFSKFVILLSESGFTGFSAPISLRIFARTDVDAWSYPVSVDKCE
jgi:hypothetical protein